MTGGVIDSGRTATVTPCRPAARSAAASTSSTVLRSAASRGARASSHAVTVEQTALAPPGSATTFPNVARVPFAAAACRAASAAAAYGSIGSCRSASAAVPA